MDSIRKLQKRKRPGVNGIQPRESQKYCQVKLHWKVKEKLKGSGFNLLFEVAHKDIFRITGLPIDGKPVCLDDEKLRVGEFGNLTGIDCPETKISLQTLVDEINNSYEAIINMDDFRVNQICRIVALLAIGCLVMQETHNKIKIKYLCLLRDVDNVKNYAWGATSWTNLHSSLIHVFALVCIPFLIPYVYKERDPQSLHNLSFPMMIEFTNIIGRDEMYDNHNPTLTEEFEALLLSVEEDDVRWTYEELSPTNGNNYYLQELLGYSVTTPVAPSLAVKHQPHLAPRQFPSYNPHNRLIQQWLEDLPPENLGRKKKKGSTKLHKKIWEKRWNQLISKEGEVLTLMYITDEHDTQSHEPSSSLPSLPNDVDRSRNRKRTNDMEDFPTSTPSLQQRQDHSRCTLTNVKSPDSSRSNKIVFKELKKLWDNVHSDLPWEKGYYNESNTLLLDDSPYKGLCEGGELRAYLHGLAKAADMQR
ncbi:HAD superfamily [Sesbania bispinosa]|nr:HAD superfamily [Sesbania bispinosa]